MTLINKYNELLKSASVSGREQRTADKIISLITPYTDTVKKDNLDNIIAIKHGRPGAKKLIIACGMDTQGFFATFIENSGMIRIAPVGEINTDSLVYACLKFENGTQGFLVTNGKKGDEASFWADIGAKNIKEAKKKVSQGDFCLPTGGGRLLNGEYYGFGASSALCISVLIELAQRLNKIDNEYEIIYLFSAQSRVGARGITPAALNIEADMVLTINSMSDRVTLGDGPVLKIKDGRYISSPELVKELCDTADENNIKLQRAVDEKDPSSLLAVQMSICAPSAAMAIPVKYPSGMGEKISMKDAENLIRLIAEFVKRG